MGSTVSVLLLFAVISHSRTFIQGQEPKPAAKPVVSQPEIPWGSSEAAPAENRVSTPILNTEVVSTAAKTDASTNKASETFVLSAQTYTATAYSLRGRTASGKLVARGLIAADPRVLPLGTRVRVEAGTWSGEYIVADTGGLVKGRRIDIWTPSSRDAMRFGRRAVKLTVLEYGGKRGKNARSKTLAPAAPIGSNDQASSKPAK